MYKIEKVVTSYIPKNDNCRTDEAKREFKRCKEKEEIIKLINEKVDMADALGIEVKPVWEKQGPNMSVCTACNETIYSPQYVLSIYVNGEAVTQERVKVLCELCYNINVHE